MANMRIARGVSTCVVAAAMVAGSEPAAQAQQPASDLTRGAAVLAEARKALGGEERLAAIKTLQINGTSRRAQGNFNLEGDTEVFLELPGKFRRNESLTVGGAGGPGLERTEGLNGTEFWSETAGGDLGGRGRGRFGGLPGGGAPGGTPADGRGQIAPEDLERLRDFQRRNLQSEVNRLLLAILLTSETPVAWIGTAQAPEGTADVLELKTPDGSATRLFIDSATRLPLMLSWTGPAGRGFGGRGGQGRRGQGAPAAPEAGGGAAPGGQPGAPAPGGEQAQGRRGRGAQGGAPATLEMHLSEYKAVNGIRFPHLITRGASGETNEEWIVKSYRINPTLRANTFTR
jgi:hypothetical protein